MGCCRSCCRPKRLSWGNGVIELGTFLAIIIGTVTGATMAEHFQRHEVYAGYALLGLCLCWAAYELRHRSSSGGRAGEEIPAQLLSAICGSRSGLMRRDRALFLAVVGNTYFWFLGSLLFSTIVVYGPDVLHIGQTKTGYLNATLAVGIGIGSMVAGLVSDNKIEYGLIPLGSIGMTLHGAGVRRDATWVGRLGGAAGNAGILGGIFCGAGECADPASTGGEGQRRNHCGGEPAVVRGDRAFGGRLLCLHRIHSSRSRAG